MRARRLDDRLGRAPGVLAVTQAHLGPVVGCVPGSAAFARPVRASSADLSAGVLATSGVDETIRLWSLAGMLEALG